MELDAYAECFFSVIILDAPSFASAFDGATDELYAQSALRALKAFNLSYIFSCNDPIWASKVHNLFPVNVHSVLFQSTTVSKCFEDTKLRCVATVNATSGIPASKIFAWELGELHTSPSALGARWSLVAAPFSGGQTYIGYDFEDTCDSMPFVAHNKRKNRAWIHANLETYLYVRHNIFPHGYFERAGNATGMAFTAALDPKEGRLTIEKYPILKGVISVPSNLEELDRSKMSADELQMAVAESKLLVGLLDPKEYKFSFFNMSFISSSSFSGWCYRMRHSAWVYPSSIRLIR